MAEKLINLPIEEARAAKWRWAVSNTDLSSSGHPLEELDEELLDAMNYAEEAARRGFPNGRGSRRPSAPLRTNPRHLAVGGHNR